MTQIRKSPRNSAIELLRILSMIMIVLSHICCHSGFDSTYSMLSVNRLFVQFGYLGNLGVALFLMISGYFHNELRSRTLSRLLCQVWFYSVSLFLVCRFLLGYTYTPEMLWQVFVPTLCQEYWFFTAYMVLYLLSPFINALLRVLDRDRHRLMLMIMACLWVLLPTLTKQQLYSAELPQFLLYYCLGAYFRMHPENRLQNRRLRWAAVLGSFGLLYGLTMILGYCERFTPEAFGASLRLYDRNSLLIFLAALGLFAVAVYGKPFASKFVNTVGGCTFGVYLIHDNPVVRDLLWKNWLHWGAYFTSGSFILRLAVSVVLVYAVCTAIEWVRQKTVARPMEAAVDKILSALLKNTGLV